MMKDMHDGYFYLKGHSRSREYNFYIFQPMRMPMQISTRVRMVN